MKLASFKIYFINFLQNIIRILYFYKHPSPLPKKICMKSVFILLLCFGTWPGFSTSSTTNSVSKAGIARDSTKEEFTSKERLKYYRNENLKRRRTIFYTMDGKEYQTIYENFRRNGARRNCWVMNPSSLIQLTRYNRKGLMKFERNYYYSGPFLQSVETRRANGKIRVQHQPEPEPMPQYKAYVLATHY